MSSRYDVNADTVEELEGEDATGTGSLDELVAALENPRAVWVMVPAGDFHALAKRGRRALRIDVGADATAGLTALREAVTRVLRYATPNRAEREG